MQMNQINVGDRLLWIMDDFDMVRPESVPCEVVVRNYEKDYAVAKTSDGMALHIDDDTIYQFERG